MSASPKATSVALAGSKRCTRCQLAVVPGKGVMVGDQFVCHPKCDGAGYVGDDEVTLATAIAATPAVRTRLSNSLWTSEELEPGERALKVCLIRDESGQELGIIEYVGIKLRGGKGTAYGWRLKWSGWTASRLKTKTKAALALVRKAV